ncbi:50S ribosomal protein L9 [Candidatus Nomurabacteria bacterium RIFCSPHIGHO2_01_FULL_39_220]|uniref:Large ribosomal subunit protein bL9 n=1 Tax=Candidatus Nomurabacteria bacterium RIFCSPLOWO2_02_FULL_40_67 TaxID=1801787 RepID=A0A1F6Y5R6_9BACT|nr:MAG: 50S ribosomal protein L9 [Parcubacteria group bacterium GW2011_GWA2_40_37]KKS71334.1 MAG: 50S ribosomal protein L9 [Parcubacteria group bacterium GW2011_GWF2_42_7]OGI62814.1 MAG: 50S ribosomal protein L9 [Candidatus Nomurabacteria bacterium RBG_16_40_11]OGI69741.1 MAG: 50S ribosomal protein L9 [Candidatus Nomurabacteria bacterium RIFCSPHIGHO2_01_FULL_39_220]OGI72600.1 MAG: 50S ribosomal protein L9 [Candidatus Nomurabacteria bacterium RIFCSPHIGHO2_02_41_18]OGI78462.1 MAG: 50S ribosomal 
MKVIFLRDVPRVGRKNDTKEVNDGYAVNFLLPRKLAVVATPKAITELELRQKEIAIEREVQESLLLKNLEAIKGKVITIKEKADEKGHLFAQVHKKEIIEAMKAQNHADIGEEFIILEKPIKQVGGFEIPISIKGKKSSFKLIIEKI